MELLAHQKRGLVEALEKRRLALFYDTGTGKTGMTLSILQRLKFCAETAFTALVLCPKSVMRVWDEERALFTPDLRLALGSGSVKERDGARLLLAQGKKDVVVLNFESFRNDFQKWEKNPPTALVIDESTKIKAPGAIVSKYVRMLSRLVDHVYLLSGCPAPNDYRDLWSQMACISDDVFGKSFFIFQRTYYHKPNPCQPWLWVPKRGAEEAIMEKVSQHALFVKKEECLDLPPQTNVKYYVTLSTPEWEAYRAFERNLVLKIQGEEIAATHAFTELMKLRQMATGLVKTQSRSEGTPEKWIETGTSKLEQLTDIVSHLKRPVIIMGQFRYEIQRIASHLRKALSIEVGTLTSDDDEKSKKTWLDRFARGTLPALTCHEKSMAHGLNLQHFCSDIVWVSLSYSWESFHQACDRIYRSGQKSACTNHILIASQTIDEVIWEKLEKKKSVGVEIVDAWKRLSVSAGSASPRGHHGSIDFIDGGSVARAG